MFEKYNIDYLSLCCPNYGCYINTTIFTIDDVIFGRPFMSFTTSGYIITKSCAKKLLDIIDNISYHIDFQILFIKYFYDINYITCLPSIINLTNSESTIAKKNNSMLIKIIDHFSNHFSWLLCVPIITIELEYEINLVIIIVILLLLLNIKYDGNYVLRLFLTLEIFLLFSIYL